jgi:release factor glutamine methyltransferase
VTTIGETLRGASDEAERRDLEVLIAEALRVDRAYLYAHGDDPLSVEGIERLEPMLRLYHAGTPVAYITGRRAFWSIELDVSSAVLIPRPETELLVELALQRLPPRARVLDLGTGSGAIALAIASQRGDCTVTATDISDAALAMAKRNAAKLRIDVDLRVGNWYAAVTGTFDLIVSNPPYIRAADPHLQALVSEPRLALVAGEEGLDALPIVVAGAPEHLAPGGWLLVEHGFDQAASVRRSFERAGFDAIETVRDVAGHERATLGKR